MRLDYGQSLPPAGLALRCYSWVLIFVASSAVLSLILSGLRVVSWRSPLHGFACFAPALAIGAMIQYRAVFQSRRLHARASVAWHFFFAGLILLMVTSTILEGVSKKQPLDAGFIAFLAGCAAVAAVLAVGGFAMLHWQRRLGTIS